MSVTGTSTSWPNVFTSDHATIKAIIILKMGATQDIGFTNATRIDSSGGQTIYSYKGTITTCLNWSAAIGVAKTVAYTFA
jgi:hypothetical protein